MAATTPRSLLLPTSRRAALTLTVVWCLLVLVQLVASHSPGLQWGRYLSRDWVAMVVLGVGSAVGALIALGRAIRLILAERGAPSSPE